MTRTAPAGPSGRSRSTLLAAIVLTALNLRTAVTSVGPLLSEVEQGIGLTSTGAGLLTATPVLCFALVGWFAPALAHRFGDHRAIAAALLLMTVGLATRPLTDTPVPFLLLTALALTGGALGNVLLPSLVKRHFPDRVGVLTAAYTTAMAVGLTAAAAATVPLAEVLADGSWRVGLLVWAPVSALAVLPWLLHLRGQPPRGAHLALRSGGRMVRSPLAWALALFFGAQSIQAYVAFGWFAVFLRERGEYSAAESGALVALTAALSIPVSAVIPTIAARMRSQRPLVLLHVSCYVVAYTGMLVAPRGGAVLWMLLVGLGAGAFPLCLTLLGLRTRTADATASLSAFSQSVGYVLAASGPVLVGVLLGPGREWERPLVFLLATVAVILVAGWYAAAPGHVEDDLDRHVAERVTGGG